MAKRRYAFTEAKLAKWTKEGRGTGDGADYKPWLTTCDVPSRGRIARILGRTTGRIHHLLSDGERGEFLERDWDKSTVDIKEQHPLDRGETRMIALAMGVRHPRDPVTNVDIVMTTDLLQIRQVGRERHALALSFKRAADLADMRVLEKLEIERRWWRARNVPWALRTELNLSKVRVENLQYLHEYQLADRWKWLPSGHWGLRSRAFLALLAASDPHTPFNEFCLLFEHVGNFEPGDGVSTMRYLASSRLLSYDLNVPYVHTRPIGAFLAAPTADAIWCDV
jgi:TnsA endonuclease N terminal